jgi:hypothetical protein
MGMVIPPFHLIDILVITTPILSRRRAGRKNAPALSSDINAFYRELARQRSWWYLALHYHAWMALWLRAWLPRRLVERIVLPAGNPVRGSIMACCVRENGCESRRARRHCAMRTSI